MKNFLICILLFHIIISKPFIIDQHNPVYLEKNKDSTSLVIKFSFHEESLGLGFNQVIGIITNQYFDYSELSTCILYHVNSGANYELEANFKNDLANESEQLNKQIFSSSGKTTKKVFCINRIYNNSFIKQGLFELRISEIKFLARSVSFVSLFTASDISENRIYLDYTPVVGSLLLYNEIDNYPHSAFGISFNFSSLSNIKKSNGNLEVYPGEKFNLNISVKSNLKQITNIDELTFVFEYEADIENLTNTSNLLIVLKKSGDKETTIPGVLFVIKSNQITFTNFDEILLPNDVISFKIHDIKTKQVTNLQFPLSFYFTIYRKNSFSIISRYSKKDFYLTQRKIVASIKPINNVNFYQGSAYPVEFTFSSLFEFNSFAFIKITPQSQVIGINSIKFITSTCEFPVLPENSYNVSKYEEGIEFTPNAFSNRPICFPLGNSLVFKLDNIKKSAEYKFTVWIYFESCGNTTNPFITDIPENILNTNFMTNKIQSYFEISFYSNLLNYKLEEEKFSLEYQFANGKFIMNNYCYNNKYYAQGSVIDQNEYDEISFPANPDNNIDSILYSEITTFSTIFFDDCDPDNAVCEFEKNLTEAKKNSFKKNFFFKINYLKDLKSFISFHIPSPIYKTETDKNKIFDTIIKFLFNRDFFSMKKTNNNLVESCKISWINNFSSSDNSLYPSQDKSFLSKQNGINTLVLPINEDNLLFTSNGSNFLFPGGFNQNGSNEVTFSVTAEKTLAFLAIMADCIEFNENKITTTKSLFSGIDFVLEMSNKDYSNIPSKVLRLVKLYSEPDFNFSTEFFNNEAVITNSPLNFHFSSFDDKKLLCVLEISGNSINSFNLKSTNSNNLYVILSNISLLEPDYFDNNFKYAVGNSNLSTTRAFGFSTNFKQNSASDTDSNYFLFLSSLLLLKTKEEGKFTEKEEVNYKNLYIPVYCPNTTNKSRFVVFTGDQNYKSDSFLLKKFLNYNSQNNINLSPLLKYIFVGEKILPINTSQVFSEASLKFNSYRDGDLDWVSTLHIFNGNSLNEGNSVECSICILLLTDVYAKNNDINLIINFRDFNSSYFYLNSIYVNNWKFQQIVFSVPKNNGVNDYVELISSSNPNQDKLSIKKNNLFSSSSTAQYKNLLRPDIELIPDSLGFFCTTKNPEKSTFISNFIDYREHPIYLRRFIVDYNKDLTPWEVVQFSSDKKESVYKEDAALNFFLEFQLPGNYPINSILSMKSSSFTTDTYCESPYDVSSVYKTLDYSSYGEYETTSFTQPCWYNEINLTMDCNTPKNLSSNKNTDELNNTIVNPNKMYVCCYSANAESISDNISLTDIYISYKNQARENREKTNNLYDSLKFLFTENQLFIGISPLVNEFIFQTQSKVGLDIKSVNNAFIENLFYTHSLTKNGLGKLFILLKFPRQILPGSEIYIEGQFNEFLLSEDLIPNCKVFLKDFTFEEIEKIKKYSKVDQNNLLSITLKSCDMTSFKSQSIGLIKITIKSLILKCSLLTSKNVLIQIHPVVVLNFKEAPFMNNTFKVKMFYNHEDVIENTKSVTVIQNQNLYNLRQLFSVDESKIDITSDVNTGNDTNWNNIMSVYPINTAKYNSYFSGSYHQSSRRDIPLVNNISIFGFHSHFLIFEDSYILKFTINIAPFKFNLISLLKSKMFNLKTKEIDNLEFIYPELNEISLFLNELNFNINKNVSCLDNEFIPINCILEDDVLNINIKSLNKQKKSLLDQFSNVNFSDDLWKEEIFQEYYNSVMEILLKDEIIFYIDGLKFIPDIVNPNNMFIQNEDTELLYLRIPFSLNFLNPLNNSINQRFNLVLGVFYWSSGEYDNTENYVNLNEKYKSLTFVSPNLVKTLEKKYEKYSNSNPNQLSNYNFYLNFDEVFNFEYNKLDYTLENEFYKEEINTPVIIISFPSEFSLALITNNYNSANIEASIIAVFSRNYNINDLMIVKHYPRKITAIGNKIYLILKNDLRTFIKAEDLKNNSSRKTFKTFEECNNQNYNNFISESLKGEFNDLYESNIEQYKLAYFKISLNNILNPNTELITTGPFSISISDPDFTKIFRIYNNNNSYIGNPFSNLSFSYESSLLITHYKGVGIQFSDDKEAFEVPTQNLIQNTSLLNFNKKQIIDIVGKINNQLLVRPGRFSEYFFEIRNKNNNGGWTILKLKNLYNSKVFNTLKEEYIISNLFEPKVSFLIGTDCSTVSGRYFIEFTSTNNKYFSDLEKSLVFVDGEVRGRVEIKNSRGVIKSNFEINKGGSIFIYFYFDDPVFNSMKFSFIVNDDSNNNSSYIRDFEVKRGEKVGYTIAAFYSQTILSNQIFIIDNNYTCFEFNSPVITLIPTLEIESLYLNPLLTNGISSYLNYQYREEVNENLNEIRFTFSPPVTPIFLTCILGCIDCEIREELFFDYKTDDPSVKHFFIETKDEIELIYKKIRNYTWRLKCKMSSVHGNIDQKQIFNADLTTFSSKSQILEIKNKPTKNTICHEFNFITEISIEKKKDFLLYCQNYFVFNLKNGCVVCVDSYNETYSKINYLNTEFYGFSPVINLFTNVKSNIYTICIFPLNNCPSDFSLFEKVGREWSKPIRERKVKELQQTSIEIKNVNIIDDDIVPDIKELLIESSKYDKGVVTFTLKYRLRLKCYVKLASGKKTPDKEEILTCINNFCKQINVSPELTSYTMNLKLLSGNYNFYTICFNDVYYHNKSTDVQKLGSIVVTLK